MEIWFVKIPATHGIINNPAESLWHVAKTMLYQRELTSGSSKKVKLCTSFSLCVGMSSFVWGKDSTEAVVFLTISVTPEILT